MQGSSLQARRRRGCLGCGFRIGFGFLGLLVLILVVGFFIQQVGIRNDQARFAPPGRQIDIGGYRLHLWCMGEPKSMTPTVLLEAGIGRTSLDWSHVLQGSSSFGQVCAYDRAGYGWSDPGPTPRSLEQISRELHTLLSSSQITNSLILVGHSYGGAVVQQYATLYPQTVAGMVLLDAMHEREWANESTEEQQYLVQQEGKLTTIALLNRFGLLRMFGSLLGTDSLPVPIGTLDSSQQAAYGSFLLRTEFYDTWLNEIQALQGTLPPHLPKDLPLIVLSARQPTLAATDAATSAAEALHDQYQTDLLTLSANSRQIWVDSGHDIPLEQPESVIEAIHSLLDELSTSKMQSS